MYIERFKEWMSFSKFILGTVILGLVATGINYYFQSREIEIKEMEQLGAYIDQVIDEKPLVRKRFAEYFATMTASDSQRKRWREYESKIDSILAKKARELNKEEMVKSQKMDSIQTIENNLENKTIKVAELESQKIQETDPVRRQEIDSTLESEREEINKKVAQRYEAEEPLANTQLNILESKKQLTYSRKTDETRKIEKCGWVYLGNYNDNEGRWERTYFHVGSNKPEALTAGDILRVSTKAVNVRAGMPEPSGRFLDIIDVISNGTQVEIIEVEKWNESGYWWASVTYSAIVKEMELF